MHSMVEGAGRKGSPMGMSLSVRASPCHLPFQGRNLRDQQTGQRRRHQIREAPGDQRADT